MITRSLSVLSLTGVFVVAASLNAAAPPEAQARNWAQWRGPMANGIVPQGDPPLEWSEDRNVRWKVPIPGQGHATPIIWENRIFILTAVSEPASVAALLEPEAGGARILAGQAGPPGAGPGEGGPGPRRRGGFGGNQKPTQPYGFTVICLDRGTGKTLWQKVARQEVPHLAVQESNTYSSGSPVTDGERLYVWFGSFGLYCYDLDGGLLWQKDLGKVDVTFGEGSSPALADGILVVVQDNNAQSFIQAYEAKSGKELWRQNRDERSGWTTPYVLTHGGRKQVIVNGSNAVRSYDLKTGEVIWQCSGLGSNPVPMIVTDDAAVYAFSGHRNPTGMAIKLGATGDLTGTANVLWKVTDITPYVPSPLLHKGLLYLLKRNSQMLSCLDAATGKPHYAEERIEAITGFYASPIAVKDRLYFAGQNGVTVVLEPGRQLKVLATNKLDDGFDASPAVVGKELFLRGRKNLYCLAAD